MRGAPSVVNHRYFRSGITPAYAGSTEIQHAVGAVPQDHPRVCGEHILFLLVGVSNRGSPPRMRGAPLVSADTRAFSRITPAYAGSTQSYAGPTPTYGDHPRVCGEHCKLGSDRSSIVGSPPRMRGAREVRHLPVLGCGITPAYAGSTDCEQSAGAVERDHPRVCGEHLLMGLAASEVLGSPPRMRGALFDQHDIHDDPGITPAYAGSTIPLGYTTAYITDHPRVCGEHI